MKVVTRFAPSPTGFLHIGGARTALFNWLFARHHAKHGDGGTFLLRIEDTDRARSTPEAVAAILDGLSWLGLEGDAPPVSQFERREQHAEAAKRLLAEGKAYRCYCSPQELTEMREAAKKEGRPVRYDGRWRDRDPAEAPAGVDPVIRLKAPVEGDTIIHDLVQGEVKVANAQLDDMVLLRADGTATYMLAVVVDDIDMAITHVIRGDDHLTNAFRQYQLYLALGATPPAFAHIPLIHGPDGAKLSKRHGALGVDAYRDMGYLPEAIRNYLLRLGWGHGDDEIISTDQAIDWFELSGVGRAASRFDFAKLTNLNGHYMRQADDARLLSLITDKLEERLGHPLNDTQKNILLKAMRSLKERSKTLNDLAEAAWFFVAPHPIQISNDAEKLLTTTATGHLSKLIPRYEQLQNWHAHDIEKLTREYAEQADNPVLKLGQIAQPLRASLTGGIVSSPIFEAMELIGRATTIDRIEHAIKTYGARKSTDEPTSVPIGPMMANKK